MTDTACYFAQVAAGICYALFLEFVVTRRRYENGGTWATVVIGVLMVGLIVRARLLWGSAPPLPPLGLIDWQWWLWVYSFMAAGVPIVGWQLIIRYQHIKAILDDFGGRK